MESHVSFEHERQRCRLQTLRANRQRPIENERLHLYPQPKTDLGIPPTLLKQYLTNREKFKPATEAFKAAKKQVQIWRIAGKLTPMDLVCLAKREQPMPEPPTPATDTLLGVMQAKAVLETDNKPLEPIARFKTIPIGRQAELSNMAIEILDNPKKLGDWKSFWDLPATGASSKEEMFLLIVRMYEETRKHVKDTTTKNLIVKHEEIAKADKAAKERKKELTIQTGRSNPREFKKTLVKTSDGDKRLAALRKTAVDLQIDLPANFMELNRKELDELIRAQF